MEARLAGVRPRAWEDRQVRDTLFGAVPACLLVLFCRHKLDSCSLGMPWHAMIRHHAMLVMSGDFLHRRHGDPEAGGKTSGQKVGVGLKLNCFDERLLECCSVWREGRLLEYSVSGWYCVIGWC